MARKQLTGVVASNKMTKTVVVSISRRIQHPVYKKLITVTKRIKADTNGMELNIGDVVRIEQTRPISRDKSFKVISKVEEKK
jgi:small subunit ribosomal protein S17